MTTTTTLSTQSNHKPYRCPYWIAWLLASPLRRLGEDLSRLAAAAARPGDRVLELGPGLGFYTLPLARRVGPDGKVIAIDAQQVMLDTLALRCQKAGINERIELLCGGDPLTPGGLEGSIDVAFLVNVVHETRDPATLFFDIAKVLRPGGTVYLREPSGQCASSLFEQELVWARNAGLSVVSQRRMQATLKK